MGFWSGIKHALNSTLGTADFQPLDKIIKSQRAYGPSDDVLVTLGSGMNITLSDSLKKIDNVKFIPNKDGSIRVKATMYVSNSSTSQKSFSFYIYENGVSLSRIQFVASSGETYTKPYYADIPIKKDAEYTFYVKRDSQGGTGRLQKIELCGRIVDLSMLEYTTY